MAESTYEYAISGVVEYDDIFNRTTADLTLPDIQPSDTYTIDRGGISIRFDGHILIHANKVTWEHHNKVGDEALISELFGEDFTETMVATKRFGILPVQFTLDQSNRLAIAEFQFKSPSTPKLLKKSVAGILHKSVTVSD